MRNNAVDKHGASVLSRFNIIRSTASSVLHNLNGTHIFFLYRGAFSFFNIYNYIVAFTCLYIEWHSLIYT